MQAVILAGGKGKRLAERLAGRPKPLIDVDGLPLLRRQIEALMAQGVARFVVLVNHAADQIVDFIAAHDGFGAQVSIVDDGEPRGTSGAVLACLDQLEDEFLVVYGDTLFDIDVDRFLRAHRRSAAAATLFLHPNDHPQDSDLVEVDDAGRITAFHPYPHPDGAARRNLVNAAFYVMTRQPLTTWRDFPPPSDFGRDLFPAMLAGGVHLQGYESFEYIKDLGTTARLERVEAHLRSGRVARASRRTAQRCVFFDRDGTLNRLRDQVRSPEDLDLLPGAAEAVRRANELEYRAVLVTNQPVVARGECTLAGLRAIHDKLETELGRSGAYLDGLYVCPHHPDAGFARERADLKFACDCRKPETGLFRRAARDFNADLAASWVVGDSTADLLAARRLGVRSILVATGEGGRDGKHAAAPDFTAEDVGEALEFIATGYPGLAGLVRPLVETVRAGDLVLIGGLARSGKSTLAAVLAAELRAAGRSAQALALDRWILPQDRRAEPGVERRYELGAALDALAPWLAGGGLSAVAPFYDRHRRARIDRQPLRAEPDEVLILEGAPALLLEPRTSRRVHRVFVEADEPMRRARMVADYRRRTGASRAQAEAVYTSRESDETPIVLRSRQTASRVLRLDFAPGASGDSHDH